jgi:MFS family permease
VRYGIPVGPALWRPGAMPFIAGLGTMFVAAHVSGTNAIFPRIISDLGVSVATRQWILTSYTLSLSVCLLVFGNLADRIGLLRVYVWGMALFGVTSLLCAFAPSASSLIALRAVQGVAAAMVSATSIAIAADSVPAGRLGRGLGCQTCMTCIGLAFGPLLSGFLTQRFGWRLLFAINIPASALAISLALMAPKSERHRPSSYMPFEVRRFRFAAATAGETVYYMCLYAIGFLIPLYLIRGNGFTTLQIGILLFSQSTARTVLAPISGRMTDRFGVSLPMWLGIVSLALAACFLGGFGNQATPVAICGALALLGVGAGLFTPANSTAMLCASPARNRGTAAGVLATARNVGMSVGVAMGAFLYLRFGGDNDTLPAVRDAFGVIAGIAIAYAVMAVPLKTGERKQRQWFTTLTQPERSL